MFGQAYGAALVVVVASVVLGRAICAVCGGSGRWRGAPLVGFAALMVLADAAMKLPGRGVTAVIVCAVAIALAGGFLLWCVTRRPAGGDQPPRPARRRSLMRLAGGDLVVGGAALLGASIPFIASGRVGPGAGIDNDMAIHLLVAEALRSSRMATIWNVLSTGYPTGPHSIVAAVGTAVDDPLIMVFTGLMLAVVVLTAIAGADLLAGEALWRRVVIGVLCSLTYLVAGFYGEGAFKEMIMAGLLLGFVLVLEQVRAAWPDATHRRRFMLVLPAGLLVAGAIYTYSYLGVAWFGATLVGWAALEVAVAPCVARRWISWRNLIAVTPWAAGFLILGVIVLIPILGDLNTFFSSIGVSPATSGSFTTSNLGNLFHPLPGIEAFGVWFSSDFRQVPSNALHAGELGGLAALAAGFGLVQVVRRRQLLLAAAAVGSALVWWYSEHSQSPYVAAKALVIGAPVVIGVALRGLLPRWRGPRLHQLLVFASALALCLGAAYSSYSSLRSEPVQAPEAGQELAAFHRLTGNASVLFLGVDDWAPWELRDSPVATLSPPTETVGGAASPPNKPFAAGQSLDFDSVIPKDLNNFPYVITTNTSFASQAPANFHLVARRRLYELWRRNGSTPQYESIEPPGNPGAVLNCHSAAGRQIAASPGVASLMTQPVMVAGVFMAPGLARDVRVPLPAGSWEISVQYTSPVQMAFAAQGRRYTMPAYVGRPGAYFNVGPVIGDSTSSPVTLHISADRPSFLSSNTASADVFTIVATGIPDVRHVIPLRQACGKYVDWFRLR